MKKDWGNMHPDESLLLHSLVDDGSLPLEVREHLASCPACSTKRESLESSLFQLGKMARHLSPKPTKRVEIDYEHVTGTDRQWLSWRWSTAAATIAASVLIVFYGSMLQNGRQDQRRVDIAHEAIRDEQFISEVTRLGENALPEIYLELSDTDDPGDQSSRHDGSDSKRSDNNADSHGKSDKAISHGEWKRSRHA